jgi:LuxR family transcriptional regulator, maltose regulon positive regulatory protein
MAGLSTPSLGSPLTSGKHFPPRLDPGLHLHRPRLIRHVRDCGGAEAKVVLVEAQAGQGKSIFAAQLVENFAADYCWYQLGTEDGDTLLLASSLLDGLCHQLPGFRAPQLERMLESGIADAKDHANLASLLLADLTSFLTRDFYLVFDDIYLLEGFPESLAFIQRLLNTAPPKLRFILTSRNPIAAAVQDLLPAGAALLVDNALLAFNRQEIAELFNGILHTPVSQQAVQSLCQLTEGWSMGLILAGQSLPEGVAAGEQALCTELLTMTRSGVLDYFLVQVLHRFSASLRRNLLFIALLDSIPVRLIEHLTDGPDAGGLLSLLHRQNFFVRPLDGNQTEFVFHHLFQDSLRALARQQLDPEEVRGFHRRVARWYLQQDQPATAAGHYFAAEDFAEAEKVLKDVGLHLQANNRNITLLETLSRIPEETVRRFGWLSYFTGIALLNVDPPRALSYLESARHRFVDDGDDVGELLTLVHRIAFHVMIDGNHHFGALHLERAADLFDRKSGDLPAVHRAHAANIFLMAFTIIHNDILRADSYYDLGLRIARELRLSNLEAEARLWRCYRHIFAGTLADTPKEIENALPLLRSPLVTLINRGGLYLAFVNTLVNNGDYDSFTYHRARLRQMLGDDLVDRSVYGAFLMAWDADLSLSRGDDERASEILLHALEDGSGGGDHLRSQFLYYQALLLMKQGRLEEAHQAIEESRRLQQEIGSPLFLAIIGVIAGAIQSRTGHAMEALEQFKASLDFLERMNEWCIRACLYAYRAWLYLDMKQLGQAGADIAACLDILHRYQHQHFYGWLPELMEKILSAAVQAGIRPGFARQLAARRLGLGFLPGGLAIPLLQVRTLGSLQISLRGRVIVRGSEMTPAQRQLLTILLVSPGHQRRQEEIAELLWPESPGDKARKNFDALLVRLRKALQDASGVEIDIRHYLHLRKGVLALEYCSVDAMDFREEGVRGLRHLKKGELWQADNVLRSALGRWQGEFLAGMALPESAEQFRHEISSLYLESACGWSRLLSADGRHEEARGVAEAALRHDPIHEEIVGVLYGIHITQGKPARARKVLKNYAAALRAEQFPEDEIDQILELFWTPATP